MHQLTRDAPSRIDGEMTVIPPAVPSCNLKTLSTQIGLPAFRPLWTGRTYRNKQPPSYPSRPFPAMRPPDRPSQADRRPSNRRKARGIDHE